MLIWLHFVKLSWIKCTLWRLHFISRYPEEVNLHKYCWNSPGQIRDINCDAESQYSENFFCCCYGKDLSILPLKEGGKINSIINLIINIELLSNFHFIWVFIQLRYRSEYNCSNHQMCPGTYLTLTLLQLVLEGCKLLVDIFTKSSRKLISEVGNPFQGSAGCKAYPVFRQCCTRLNTPPQNLSLQRVRVPECWADMVFCSPLCQKQFGLKMLRFYGDCFS